MDHRRNPFEAAHEDARIDEKTGRLVIHRRKFHEYRGEEEVDDATSDLPYNGQPLDWHAMAAFRRRHDRHQRVIRAMRETQRRQADINQRHALRREGRLGDFHPSPLPSRPRTYAPQTDEWYESAAIQRDLEALASTVERDIAVRLAQAVKRRNALLLEIALDAADQWCRDDIAEGLVDYIRREWAEGLAILAEEVWRRGHRGTGGRQRPLRRGPDSTLRQLPSGYGQAHWRMNSELISHECRRIARDSTTPTVIRKGVFVWPTCLVDRPFSGKGSWRCNKRLTASVVGWASRRPVTGWA